MALELIIGAGGGVRHDQMRARRLGRTVRGQVLRKSQSQLQVDDGYLLALAKQGSPDAYDRLVRRYYSFVRLKASSYFLIGGDSEDLSRRGSSGSTRPSATTAPTASRRSATSPSSASPGRSSPR